MLLISINQPDFDVEISLAYATPDNITQSPIYHHAHCYLHKEAGEKLKYAIQLAKVLGYRFKIFDAFRPSEAQWVLWNKNPDPNFLADPRRGSPHSRGVAIDLTLLDQDNKELDMGTKFDEFSPLSHHGNLSISEIAQKNRAILLGIMTAAGWDFYRNEWWHYQLFNSRYYPLISDKALPKGLMS
ncbi:MAG: D-alanyl-D-alanine dipeptidase [Alphaproteobacteria bacterium]|nr:D-alanyl-D-alanine dipeptidase [Alphaproteobacteria bacterium]